MKFYLKRLLVITSNYLTAYWLNSLGMMNSELIKRIFDLTLAFLACIALSPVMIVIAVLIRFTMGKGVFFRQMRPGLHGKSFTMYKFRTMTDCCDEDGRLLPDSERLTSLGKFLRSTSLDELPELFNVLKGEMSLVGPRPLLMRYCPYFTEEERVRFLVRPGITGLAQISGRNDLPWDLRIAADVKYVQEWSLWLDIRILIMTLWHLLSRKGVRIDPGANMLDFDEERRSRLRDNSS